MEMLPTLNNQCHARDEIKIPLVHLMIWIKKNACLPEGLSHDSRFIHIFLLKFTKLSMDQGTQMILLCWNETKECLFWDFGLIYKLLLAFFYDKWITNIPISSSNTIQNELNMDLSMITFFPSFFNSMTTGQHKKSTITINTNFKQLRVQNVLNILNVLLATALRKC